MGDQRVSWVVFNDRDMFCGEYDTREDAYARCGELNSSRAPGGPFRVVEMPRRA